MEKKVCIIVFSSIFIFFPLLQANQKPELLEK